MPIIYIISTIVGAIAIILGAFGKVLTNSSYEFGSISGVGNVLVDKGGSDVSYIDMFPGGVGIALSIAIAGVAVVTIVWAIINIKNKSYEGKGYIGALYLFPIIFIVIFSFMSTSSFQGNSNASYGGGTDTSISGLGILVIVLCVLSGIGTAVGLYTAGNKITEEKPKQNKKVVKNYIDSDDFSVK